MADINKNLEGSEALKQIITLVKHVRSCQMITGFGKRPISVRPMAIQKIDDSGRMYFLSEKNSEKIVELGEDDAMQITITNDNDSEYLNLFGSAEIYRDQKEIDEIYSFFADNWFKGKDDPEITIIRFNPEKGYYWDTRHGKIVQFAGMVAGAISGKPLSDGVEGKIEL